MVSSCSLTQIAMIKQLTRALNGQICSKSHCRLHQQLPELEGREIHGKIIGIAAVFHWPMHAHFECGCA